QDEDQNGKDDYVRPAGGYELSAERFDEPDHDAPDHGARDAADAPENRRGEGLEAGGVTDHIPREVVIEAEDQAGAAGQGRAEEERDHDHGIDLDAHHAGRFLILGRRL